MEGRYSSLGKPRSLQRCASFSSVRKSRHEIFAAAQKTCEN